MTNLAPLISVVFAAVLGALAVLQVLLILGMPLGRFAWGGQHDRLPLRLRAAACLSVLIYVIFAGVALAHAHLITTPVPSLIIVIAMWVITAYLFLSVLPNLASKSVHEKRLMTPVSAVLAILALLIALL